MAGPYFVDSVSGNNTGGTSWATAYTTIAACIAGTGGTALAAGDRVYIGDDHNETTAAAVTWTFPGTITSPNIFLCADHTVGSPTSSDLKLTGKASTTGASSNIVVNGSLYCYGMTLSAGDSANPNLRLANSGTAAQYYVNCKFIKNSSAGSGQISFTNAAAYLDLDNCTVKFSHASDSISSGAGRVVWRNTASAIDVTGTLPNSFFSSALSTASFIIEGVDLSGWGSGKTMFAAGTALCNVVVKDCKLPASTTISAALTTNQSSINAIRSDSGTSLVRTESYSTSGSMTTSTAIYRTGGASDGTTNYSRAVLTPTTRVTWNQPFVAPPIAIWNNTIGTVNVTVHAVSNLAAGAFPNNDDIWIDVEYESDGSSLLGAFANNSKANILSSATAYDSTGAGSWVGSPAGGAFVMTKQITVNQAGYIYAYVKVGNTRGGANTYYFDPLMVLS